MTSSDKLLKYLSAHGPLTVEESLSYFDDKSITTKEVKAMLAQLQKSKYVSTIFVPSLSRWKIWAITLKGQAYLETKSESA